MLLKHCFTFSEKTYKNYGCFHTGNQTTQRNEKIEKAVLEMLVLEESRFNWRRRRTPRRLLWKFWRGLLGSLKGSSGAQCRLVVVSDFSSGWRLSFSLLLQAYHECLWASIEAIVSLCTHKWKELLRGAKDHSEATTGDGRGKGGVLYCVLEGKATSTAVTATITTCFLGEIDGLWMVPERLRWAGSRSSLPRWRGVCFRHIRTLESVFALENVGNRKVMIAGCV